MRIRSLLAVALFAFAAGGTLAADKDAKQAEIRKSAQASLERFYKKEPKLQSEVKAAPGYAVFTTYGASLVVGGAGGTGIAHSKSGKDAYMNMAQASAGIQGGIGQRDLLVVFKTQKALDHFVANGWEFGGEGTMSAGAGGKTAGGGVGKQEINEAQTYSLTKNGLEVGAALAGTKFWKDKDLN